MTEYPVICKRTSPYPWKNLSPTADHLKSTGSLMIAINPRPDVVRVMSMNPNRIVFFAPIRFLINALNGAKIIYATENTAKIKEVSFSFRARPFQSLF